MFKRKAKKKLKNQGNSYIMVVATISFLAVLVAAMLVAVALCYRLKAYDINARDNFYYLEQAMDEIYAGVGADAMKHLNTAYDDTVEILVYFDPSTQAYVTMKNDEANRILKNTYMKLVKDDANYQNSSTVLSHLESFVSNLYDATNNAEGVSLQVGNVNVANDDELVITNLILKREAVYSTVNARKQADGTVGAGDTFVQTITTDLVIGKPEFDVNFNTIESDLSELYKFAFVADKGVEIGNATSKVNITGNIYAAADFYNKDYNITDHNDPNYISKSEDDGTVTKYAAVSSYTDSSSDSRYKEADGKREKSMYSGIYINGADVIIFADRIIVPGTIAAFNSAELNIYGSSGSDYNSTEIWADSIVLGGYSFINNVDKTKVNGATIKMRADAYIADDLELNAKGSKFSMVGQYYGYNYATLDNRTYTDVCVKANGGRTFTTPVASTIADGASIDGQAHYNSSAIIVNGEDSSLDLSSVTNMYIAGQAYIETSKVTTKHDKAKDASGNDTADAYTVTNKNGDNEAVSYNTYEYPDMDERTVKEVDEAGNETTKKVDDNYTEYTESTNKTKKTTIQDYRTGEAISIKSNQLAYVPNWAVADTEEGLFLTVPTAMQSLPILNDFWDDKDENLDIVSKIPVIKTVISGKTYYFLDFSTNAKEKAGLTDDKVDVMNKFIEAYSQMFDVPEGSTTSAGELYGLTDITDYDYFKIEMLKINTSYDEDTGAPEVDADGNYSKIYSNSAISVKNGTSFTIKADSSSINPLISAARRINSNISEQNSYVKTGETGRTDNIGVTGQSALTLAKDVTTRLQGQYKEVKWTLTPRSSSMDAVNAAHAMEESDITPINYFFFFNKLSDKWNDIEAKLKSGYKIWVTTGDVEVDATSFADGNVKGMIICKGDVTFKDDVKSFEGLIVSGSKIKVEHSMNFAANEEIVKTILRECDESQLSATNNYFAVCGLFQKYQPIYTPEGGNGKIETESTKSITAVQFEDVLSYDNWKKNVD